MARRVSVEVLDVSPVESDGEDLIAGSIRPLPAQDDGSLTITGWVIGRGSRATAVELVDGDEVVGHAAVGLKRPDIAEVFPNVAEAGTCGFRVTMQAEGQGESELLARAILDDGTQVPIRSVRVKVSRQSVLRRLLT
jgi:hypothetical protein